MVTTSITSRTRWGGSTTWVNGQLTTVTHHHPYSGATFTWDFGADAAPAAAQAPQASVVTGIDPSEIHNALYGKIIPLSALGLARIGTAGLIFGPYFNAGAASFGVSFGFPANPTGERRVYEIALDGKVAWENAAGSPAGALGAGFISPPFECRFYSGTQTQAADPLEAAMFGAEAVAYRPQMMLWFSNLPVAEFGGKVPFVSCKIGEVTGGATPGDGINLGEALERFAYSPWLEYDSSDFETTGVADIVQAMILTEDQSFLELLQTTARVYRTLDILQTDKLRINDRGSLVTPDVILHRDNISADAGVQYLRMEEATVPRELELVTIDPDADFVFMPSKAQRPLAPVPVTASVGKATITLPVVVDANTRASLVTYAKYQEDNARKRLSLQTMLYGYALEPGDLFRLVDVAGGFDNSEVWKVAETSHGANYINEISAEAILKCAFELDEDYDVIVLLHGEALDDASTYDETVALESGATFDTTNKKFGAASFRFDADTDGFASSLWGDQYDDLSPTNTSPYTIELWANFDQIGRTHHQALISRDRGLNGRIFDLLQVANEDRLAFITFPDGSTQQPSISAPAAGMVAGVWYHIAVDKDSTGKVRIYVNGVMKGSSTPANSVLYGGDGTRLTVGNNVLGLWPMVGNIDDVRITKGTSRYGDLYGDATFPVPSGQFPDPT